MAAYDRDGWDDEWDRVFTPDPMGTGTVTGDRSDSTRQDFDTVFSTTYDTGPDAGGVTTPAPSPPPTTGQGQDWRTSVNALYEQYLGRSAGEGDYGAAATNPGGLPGIESTVRGSREAQGYTQVRKYQQQVQNLSTISDPQQRAIQRDQLARDIYNNLRNAGHDVTWQGDTLIVDGRAYQIAGAGEAGGGTTTTNPAGASAAGASAYAPRLVQRNGRTYLQEHGNERELQPNEVAAAQQYVNDFWAQYPTGFQPGVGPQDNAGYRSMVWGFDSPTGGRKEVPFTPQQYSGEIGPYSGYEASKIGQDDSIKYRWLEFTRGLPPTVESLPEIVRRLNAAGIPARQVGYDLIDFGLGEGPVDILNQTRGGVWDWMPTGAGGDAGGTTGGGGVQTGGPTGGLTGGGGAGGVPTGGPSGTGTPGTSTDAARWQSSAPPYVPGAIPTDDLDALSFDQVLGALGENYAPGAVTGGAVEDPLEASVLNLLQNPSALDDRTVEMLKARSKEEQAGLYEQELDALTALGAQANISDSNWLAAERQGARRSRDEALIRGNREIDIQAANQRKADERAAIATGQTYAEGRRSLAQRNIDNAFKSQAEKRAAVALASDTHLNAAMQRGQRMELREAINQKATELGLSADRLQLDYTLGLLADATERYGIDVGAQIDREKLRQAGREFQEDLAFRIWSFGEQLAQDDAQFGADWRLRAGALQLEADRNAWDRYATIFND